MHIKLTNSTLGFASVAMVFAVIVASAPSIQAQESDFISMASRESDKFVTLSYCSAGIARSIRTCFSEN